MVRSIRRVAVVALGVALSCNDVGAPPVASQLVISDAPTLASAGAALAPAVRVEVQDAAGNIVPSATTEVTITLTAANGALLGGTTVVAAVAGVANFGNLSVEKAGTGYTLTAAAPGLTSASTSGFAVTAAAPAKLVVSSQPTAAVAGSPMAPAATVIVQDAFGNTAIDATTAVTLAITPGTGAIGAVLSGTLTRTPIAGSATFDDLTIDKAASGYTFTASAGSMTAATSTSFTVAPAAAVRLDLLDEPTNEVAGVSLDPALRVALSDAFGNRAASSTPAVSIVLVGGPAAATLLGTTTRTPVEGVATFTGLVLDSAGVGYRVAATASGLQADTSGEFSVAVGAPARLTITGLVDTEATDQLRPSVRVLDAMGNLVPSDTTVVTLSITAGTGPAGAALTGLKVHTTEDGVTAWDGFDDGSVVGPTGTLWIGQAGTGYRLTASSPGLEDGVSVPFDINPGGPRQLKLVLGFPVVLSGQSFNPNPQIALVDWGGNISTMVNGGTPTITQTSGGNGFVSISAGAGPFINGIATVTGSASAVSDGFGMVRICFGSFPCLINITIAVDVP